ncbi:MAG TPA: tetratricopeptide repeat protein [Cytophagales bacterium]|nr:tetratricopeptide repeat protein [Cytophagales bacterium]
MKQIFSLLLAVLAFSSCKQIQEENNLLVTNPTNAISFDASKDMLDKRIQEDPNSSILYFKRAQLYLEKRYLELAMTDIDKALKIDRSPHYYLLKSKVLYALEDTSGLDYCLKQYERSTIDDYEYYEIKAYLLSKKHFYRKALDEINLGISKAPFYNPFYKKKGLTYLALKDTTKGEKYLMQAYIHDSSMVDNYFELARFYQKTHRKQESDKFLANGLKKDTSHYGLNLLKGNNFYMQHKYDSALTYYNKSVAQNPKNEESVYQRAKLYMDMFRFVAAQTDWQKVLKLNSHNETAYKYLAICYLENGEAEKAQVLFERLYQSDTSDVEIKKYLHMIKNTEQKVAINTIQNATLHTPSKRARRDTTKADSLR